MQYSALQCDLLRLQPHLLPLPPAMYMLYAAVCCSVLQCVAVCRSVLQCVAECCSVLKWDLLHLHLLPLS